jgi:hypothetical protein
LVSIKLKILEMKIFAILCNIVLPFACSSAILKDDQEWNIDFEAKFDAELKYYQAHPVKAKKRFSSMLTRLSSPETLNRVRYAKARKSKSMDKKSDAIARKMIRLMKKRGSRASSTPYDPVLQERANSSMTKVSIHNLTILVPYGGLGESSFTK